MNYRFYELGNDGRIKRAEVIECSTDAVALEEAERRLLTCGYPAIEVWEGGRRIGAVCRSNGRLEKTPQTQEASTDVVRPQS